MNRICTSCRDGDGCCVPALASIRVYIEIAIVHSFQDKLVLFTSMKENVSKGKYSSDSIVNVSHGRIHKGTR